MKILGSILALTLLVPSAFAQWRVPAEDVTLDLTATYSHVNPTNGLQSGIETLDGVVGTNTSQVASNTANIAALTTTQTTHTADISALTTTQTTHTADIASNLVSITTLQNSGSTNSVSKSDATNLVSYLIYHAVNTNLQNVTGLGFETVYKYNYHAGGHIEHDPHSIWSAADTNFYLPTPGYYTINWFAAFDWYDATDSEIVMQMQVDPYPSPLLIFDSWVHSAPLGATIFADSPGFKGCVSGVYEYEAGDTNAFDLVYYFSTASGPITRMTNLATTVSIIYLGPTLPEDL